MINKITTIVIISAITAIIITVIVLDFHYILITVYNIAYNIVHKSHTNLLLIALRAMLMNLSCRSPRKKRITRILFEKKTVWITM